MYAEVRWTLILLAIAIAAFPGWLAARIVTRNLAVSSSWKRDTGVVVSLAAEDSVEVELGADPDTRRVHAPTDHQIGLSFLKKVPVYIDPADPARVALGGLFQMWLWPAALILAAIVLLSVAAAARSVDHIGSWTLTPPPPPLQTDIRVHRPRSEFRAPLFWSLLGAATLACGLLLPSARQIPRTSVSALGLLFMLSMWALALHNQTTEISADSRGMLRTSAFGWSQLRWEQLGSVEKEQTIFGRRNTMLRQRSTTFPGREVTAIVFADRAGRTLMRMSDSMQPPAVMNRLLDLCAERTGLRLEFRRIYEPNL